MKSVKELMSPEPITIQATGSLGEAARLMRDRDVGLLPVLEGERLIGVVTDRDIVVRGLAREGDLPVGAICSRELRTLDCEDNEATARKAMQQWKVRRLPVQEGGKLVGVVSVGDLAVRAGPHVAGRVMEETGPEPEQRPRSGQYWPGAELTRNRLSNESELADPDLADDIQRDISQSGTTLAP
jgi:CBS domain-containing protein